MSSHDEIRNLLFRYAEALDTTTDFSGLEELFAHARIRVLGEGDATIDGPGLVRIMTEQVVRHPDGLLHTKHVTTNAIVEVDEEAGTATARSYYTVFQQLDDFQLQPIVTGRYHDEFERADGRWRFSFRDYTLVDQVGDLGRHLRMKI